ncbi:MAG TPA: class I SAM-dependent methyltransferase [Polyangia bacterium]|nr:class I SAM-dependent methyltransferase [Polyangia bacterium]
MDQRAYGEHADAEERHWWFAARRRIVRDVVASLGLPPPSEVRLLEFGSGTGGNLPMLAEFGAITALEPNDEARAIAGERMPRARHVASLDELDEHGDAAPFHAALALDVIEHLDEPEAILRDVRARLHPGAPLVVTVPAHAWMFGDHDRYLHHRRRYSKPLLRAHLEGGGFSVEWMSFMNCALFPLAIAARGLEAARARLRPAREPAARGMELPPAVVNRVFLELFAAERFLIGRGAVPTGLSLIGVARA